MADGLARPGLGAGGVISMPLVTSVMGGFR
jgi:hypothetical protein